MKPPSIHIIAPYPRGKAPSQRFRFEQYIPFLEKNGFKIYHHSFHSTKSWERLYQQGQFFQKAFGLLISFMRRWVLLFQLIPAKHIFIHREVAHVGPPLFEFIIAKILRKKYIYDFDDAIWIPNYSESNAKFQWIKAYWKVNYCMKWAHKITAGNEYLDNYARQFNQTVEVIPTTIDTKNYHNKTINYESRNLVIGWTGTHSTMHYLDDIIPVLSALEKKVAFTFRIISDKKPSFHLDSLEYIPWDKTSEIEELLNFSVGIMPLKHDKWSNGKCGFKALQYMSLGIPTIVSPVGVNTTIIEHTKNGFLASSQQDWETLLVKLLTFSELRKEIGLNGQKTIIKKYSVLANEQNYLNLFMEKQTLPPH